MFELLVKLPSWDLATWPFYGHIWPHLAQTGATWGDRFELVKKLGQGGFGAVYQMKVTCESLLAELRWEIGRSGGEHLLGIPGCHDIMMLEGFHYQWHMFLAFFHHPVLVLADFDCHFLGFDVHGSQQRLHTNVLYYAGCRLSHIGLFKMQ